MEIICIIFTQVDFRRNKKYGNRFYFLQFYNFVGILVQQLINFFCGGTTLRIPLTGEKDFFYWLYTFMALKKFETMSSILKMEFISDFFYMFYLFFVKKFNAACLYHPMIISKKDFQVIVVGVIIIEYYLQEILSQGC